MELDAQSFAHLNYMVAFTYYGISKELSDVLHADKSSEKLLLPDGPINDPTFSM